MNLTSSNKNPKNKLFINIALCASVLVALVYFAILPTMEMIDKSKNKVIQTKINIKNNKDNENNLDQLTKNLETIEPQIDKLNSIFINRNKELEFITTIEGLASKNNVEQNFELSNFPQTDDKFSTIALTINSKGSFIDLMNYLQDIEASNFYIKINTISISGTGNKSSAYSFDLPSQNNSSIVNMTLKADTFFK